MTIGLQQGLSRLTITPFSKEKNQKQYKQSPEITVLFNPESYAIAKSVTWSPPQTSTGGRSTTQNKVNAPTLSFGGGGSRQLSLELFFDVTTPINRNGKPVVDVREETNKIVALTRIGRNEEHPPVCKVSWGQAPVDSDFPFIGVVSNLTQKFTLFKSDGTPVRANLTVTFVEFLDPELDKRKTDPELTTRIVRGGDTLSGIAAEMYNDPTRWRIVAEANRINDPRRLAIRQTLKIPKIR
jgi:hypothetical protein